MKNKIEIIDETVAYYSENPEERRAFNNSRGCDYLSPTGRMCAVGRCLESPQEFMEGGYKDKFVRAIGSEILDLNLKEEYRGHEIQFWAKLQSLHDSEKYWNSTGLSVDGENYIKQLKQLYSDTDKN